MDERRWVSALLDIVIVPPARLVIQSGDFDFPDSYDDLFGIDLVFLTLALVGVRWIRTKRKN